MEAFRVKAELLNEAWAKREVGDDFLKHVVPYFPLVLCFRKNSVSTIAQ